MLHGGGVLVAAHKHSVFVADTYVQKRKVGGKTIPNKEGGPAISPKKEGGRPSTPK